MKKPFRGIVFCSIALLCVLGFAQLRACGFFQVRNAQTPKQRVFDFVLENEARLIGSIREKTISQLEKSGIIEDVYEHEAYIEFSCGGSGFGPNTSYWGFYYALSENAETAVRAFFDSAEFTECGSGLELREEYGDNYHYTENITGRFYYCFSSY